MSLAVRVFHRLSLMSLKTYGSSFPIRLAHRGFRCGSHGVQSKPRNTCLLLSQTLLRRSFSGDRCVRPRSSIAALGSEMTFPTAADDDSLSPSGWSPVSQQVSAALNRDPRALLLNVRFESLCVFLSTNVCYWVSPSTLICKIEATAIAFFF